MYSFSSLEPVPCPVLTIASWSVYKFLRRTVKWSGIPISWRDFPVCCDPHSQRLYLSQWSRSRCFSGILLPFLWSNRYWQFDLWLSAFSKSSLNIWKFSVHKLLNPTLKDFEHYLAGVWNECNCVVVWTFFGIAFLWDWNENWPFPVLWPLLSFPNLLVYWMQHFHSIIF